MGLGEVVGGSNLPEPSLLEEVLILSIGTVPRIRILVIATQRNHARLACLAAVQQLLMGTLALHFAQ